MIQLKSTIICLNYASLGKRRQLLTSLVALGMSSSEQVLFWEEKVITVNYLKKIF